MPRKPKPMRHGTPAGYDKHIANPEKYGEPCDPCKGANADRMKQYRKTHTRDRSGESEQRRRRAAAIKVLIANHQDEFETLLKESAS